MGGLRVDWLEPGKDEVLAIGGEVGCHGAGADGYFDGCKGVVLAMGDGCCDEGG